MDDEKIVKLRNVAVQLLSKESLTKIAFGVIGNVVDGSTLFLNSRYVFFYTTKQACESLMGSGHHCHIP